MLIERKRRLRPIEICPNGHYYNSSRTGDICAVCGAKLDPPKSAEELDELTKIQEKDWIRGWLICIKGPNKGNGYIIKDGKSFIGSAASMDIQIIGDKKIDKHNHASIAYDHKTKTAMLIPGETRGMIYWQNQAVFAPQKLSASDKIEIGESVFSYIPFDDADYAWEEEQTKNVSAGKDAAQENDSNEENDIDEKNSNAENNTNDEDDYIAEGEN